MATHKIKIRKGDRVRVLSGKDTGSEGEVMFALPEVNRVIVEGVNIARKHQKPTKSTMQGGVIDKDMPIHVSNVAVVCPSCAKATRVGHRFDADGEKFRVCKKCGADL